MVTLTAHNFVDERVFLVGCVRSGTTLLQSLIAAHSAVTSFPESHFFARVQAKWRWLRPLGLAASDARTHLRAFFQDIGHEDVLQSVEPWELISVRSNAQTFVRGLDIVAEKRNASIWLEKTPQHLHYVEDIKRWVSEAKFVHIVRRGEDVVASMFDVTHRHPGEWGGARDVETCLQRWCRDIDLTLEYSSARNHAVVHYHDVVNSTESVLRRICGHLSVDYEKHMLERHREVAEEVTTEQEPWKQRATGKISQNHNKFRDVFDSRERSRIKERVEDRNRELERFMLPG